MEEIGREELEAALRRYLELLLERNRVTNLTAVRDPGEAWEKLIAGSLVVLEAHTFSGAERIADIGSGGGVPGIPVALTLPGTTMTLVESDQKKAAFLRDAVEALGLAGRVEVESRRAEEVGRDPRHREGYDIVLTRAAAKAPVAAELCLPLVRQGGKLLALAREGDWRDAARAVGQLGGRLAGYRAGTVVVNKVRATPEQYPRRVGVPGMRPL